MKRTLFGQRPKEFLVWMYVQEIWIYWEGYALPMMEQQKGYCGGAEGMGGVEGV